MVYAVKNIETGEYYRLRKNGEPKTLKWLEAYSTVDLANTTRLIVEDRIPELLGKLYVIPVPVVK